MYFDAHIHLMNINTLKFAQEKGIKSFILNATNQNEWKKILEISSKISNIYPCIGIHPWFIGNLPSNWLYHMENLLQKHPTLMVGEIGLDYTKNEQTQQQNIFKQQLELAKKYHRPAHIHTVKSWHSILQIIKQYPTVRYLFHKFNASLDIIQKLSPYDTYFSIDNLKNSQSIPVEKLLVETDSPNHNKSPIDIISFVETMAIPPKQLYKNFQNFISYNKGI